MPFQNWYTAIVVHTDTQADSCLCIYVNVYIYINIYIYVYAKTLLNTNISPLHPAWCTHTGVPPFPTGLKVARSIDPNVPLSILMPLERQPGGTHTGCKTSRKMRNLPSCGPGNLSLFSAHHSRSRGPSLSPRSLLLRENSVPVWSKAED